MADKSAIEWTEATWNPVTGVIAVMTSMPRLETVNVAPSNSEE